MDTEGFDEPPKQTKTHRVRLVALFASSDECVIGILPVNSGLPSISVDVHVVVGIFRRVRQTLPDEIH